jgi:hypothetical protein
MYKAPLLALALTLFATAPLNAQVIVLPVEFDGDLTAEDQSQFVSALENGISRGAPGEVVGAERSTAELGDLAACDGGDCILAIGLTVPASVAVITEVYAEAEIYDYTIRVFDLNTGETIVTQTGDCTFCPVAEATESLGFTAEAALGAVNPMPEPTRGSEPEPEDPLAVVVEPDPETEVVEPVPTYEAGEIRFNLSVVPDTAVITVNGFAQGEGRASLDMAPQDFAVGVTASGYQDYEEEITLRASMTGPIFLRVVMSPDAPIAAVVEPATPRRTSGGPAFNSAAVGGTLIGIGLATAAGGIALLALDGNTTCTDGPSELCRDVWEFTAGGATMTTLGGLALGTGLGVLIAGARSDDAGDESSLRRFSFAPGEGGGRIFFSTDF